MSERSQDMLCKAQDMARNAVNFYENAIGSCTHSLGREILIKLREDKLAHIGRLTDIHAGLTKGQSWEAVCVLPPEDALDADAFFARLAVKHPPESCPASELDALVTAKDLEQRLMTFYTEKQAAAQDPVEREFLERMVQETRAHHLLVQDMIEYLHDPEDWYMRHERAGLDGA